MHIVTLLSQIINQNLFLWGKLQCNAFIGALVGWFTLYNGVKIFYEATLNVSWEGSLYASVMNSRDLAIVKPISIFAHVMR